MIGWLLGTLLVLILAAKLFEIFELFDVLDYLTATLRLIGVLFFGIVSLIVWMTKRMFAKANSRA